MSKRKKLDVLILSNDFISLIFSFMISSYVYLAVYLGNGEFYKNSFKESLILFVISYIFVNFFTSNRNRLLLKRNVTEELFNVIRNGVGLGLFVSVLAFVTKSSDNISRGVIMFTILIFICVCYLGRILLKKLVKTKNGKGQENILIVTNLEEAESDKLIREITGGLHNNIIGFAIMDDSIIGESVSNYSVAADKESLVDFACKEVLDSVLFILPYDEWKSVEEIVSSLQSMGIVVNLGIDMLTAFSSFNREIDYVGNYPVISCYETTHSEESMIIKRFMDIIGGIVGSIITIFVAIILGPIIKLESPGPVFFKQKRVGKNGRYFYIYKFRSMGVNAEQQKAALMDQNEVEGHMFKMTNHPRVTKVGAFIRATSIDELPQFFNVLKGDMSLVGTRPPTVEEFKQYEPHHKRRLSLKPGITGLWQVSGRSDITDFEEVVRLDVKYIDNCSIANDMKILIKTVFVVFAKVGSK